MMKKNVLAAVFAAAAMTVAMGAHAADAAQPPVPNVPSINARAPMPAPKVAMTEAVASAQQAWHGDVRSASLHMSRQYGQVWDVRMVRDDKTRVRTFVDAETGKVVAGDQMGINEANRPAPRMGRHARGPMQGAPHHAGFGPHFGPGMNPNCPMVVINR